MTAELTISSTDVGQMRDLENFMEWADIPAIVQKEFQTRQRSTS